MPAKPNERARAKYGVPDQDSTLVTIATDKEAEYTTTSVYFKMPHRNSTTVGGYRQDLTEALFSQMLNDRLDEIRQKPDAPFIGAGGGKSTFLGDRDAFTLTAFVPDGGVLRGLDAVLAEAVRVQKHGFTALELRRAKQNLLRSYERTYAERDKRQSAALVGELVRNFLEQEAIPGIEYEYPLAQRLIPASADRRESPRERLAERQESRDHGERAGEGGRDRPDSGATARGVRLRRKPSAGRVRRRQRVASARFARAQGCHDRRDVEDPRARGDELDALERRSRHPQAHRLQGRRSPRSSAPAPVARRC